MTSSDRAWRFGAGHLGDLTPEQVIAQPDGSGWVFGWRGGPAAALGERTGVIVRVDAAGQVTTTWEGAGWVRAGSIGPGAGFAVVGHPGPRFSLLRTTDGARWEDLGELPLASATTVLTISKDEAWILGAEGLCRWAGAAAPVRGPGERDSTRDRLFRVGDAAVLATPDGLWIARDGGARWGHRHVDGAHVRALASPYVAARHGGRLRIGRLTAAFVDWLGEVEGRGDPAALAWEGGAVQLAVVPDDPAEHPGLVLVASSPRGGFERALLHLPPAAAWLGLAGARGVLAVTADRRLLQSGP